MSDRLNYTVDTSPMAQSLENVSQKVTETSVAVVAMKAAVVAAETKAADDVCKNINKGFYTLMQSQITQKIAQLQSTVETKLVELGQQAIALENIQKRMERDYNMIVRRYSKLFGSLNSALKTRIYELDKPVVIMVNKDMQLSNHRVLQGFANISTHQNESLRLNTEMMVSKTKKDSEKMLGCIHGFTRNNLVQKKITDELMRNGIGECTQDIYVPLMIYSSSSNTGADTRVYMPQSGDEVLDAKMEREAHNKAVLLVNDNYWTQRESNDRMMLEAEYKTLVSQSNTSDKVKKLALELFEKSKISQLKGSK